MGSHSHHNTHEGDALCLPGVDIVWNKIANHPNSRRPCEDAGQGFKKVEFSSWRTPSQQWSMVRQHGVVVVLCCRRTCELHKANDIMRKENYVDMLKQNLETSARKLKFGCKLSLLNLQWPQTYLQGQLTQIHQFCLEEQAKIPEMCTEKLGEGSQKCFTQVTQFKVMLANIYT